MKRYRFLLICTMVLLAWNFVFAQRDYEIVHNFNVKFLQLEQSIKTADSLAQLNQIQDSIMIIKQNFQDHKALLDKSLYPYDFNGSFAKLQKELDLRKQDFTQISTLKTQVSGLTLQLDTLNSKNNELFSKVQDLELQTQKDANQISMLKHNVSILMISLHKRDGLIMAMLDSLMPSGILQKEQLTQGEKQKVLSKAEKENVISNVNRAIDDNIKFLEITSLSPKDIDNIKRQQQQFQRLWTGMGSKFAALYSEKGKGTTDINNIDIKFAKWRNAITAAAWSSISNNFAKHGINLNQFSSGNEFTNVVTMHIRDEIKDFRLEGKEAKANYTVFADSAWFGDIQPTWVPFLKDNNMLSNAQQDTIETALADWHDAVSPSPIRWFYIVIIVGLLALFIIYMLVRSSKKSRAVIEKS